MAITVNSAYSTFYSPSSIQASIGNTFCTIDSSTVLLVSTNYELGSSFVKVGTVGSTTTNWGSQTFFPDYGRWLSPSAFLVDTNKVLIFGNQISSTLKYVVGTISSGSISFGAVTSVSVTLPTTYGVTMLSSTSFIVAANGYCVPCTFNGTSLTFGSTYTYDASFVPYIKICTLNSTSFLITWADNGASPILAKSRVGTLSGGVISYGTEVTVNAGGVTSVDAIAFSDTLVTYFWGPTTGTAGLIISATISGTTITIGSSNNFSAYCKTAILLKISASTGLVIYGRSDGLASYAQAFNSSLVTETAVSIGDIISHQAATLITPTSFIMAYTAGNTEFYDGRARMGTLPVLGKKINGITYTKWNGITIAKLNNI